MPTKVYTQSFTVTLTDATDELGALLTGSLEHTSNSYEASEHFSFNIEEGQSSCVEVPTAEEELAAEQEAVERDKKLRARNAQLLELKGWLFGENEKKRAGLPSEWDQQSWGQETSCGTSCCIAGKVVLDAGGTFVGGILRGGVRTFEEAVMPDGERVAISERAREILDLDNDQRNALFAGGNRYGQAAAIIDAIVGGTTGPAIWTVRAEAFGEDSLD